MSESKCGASFEGIKNTEPRTLWALERLCGEAVPRDLFYSWMSDSNTDLQDWVSARVPAGVMAIVVIDAATSIGMECEE